MTDVPQWARERADKLLSDAPHDRSHADAEWLQHNVARALAETRRSTLEEAAQLADDNAAGCRVEAETIRTGWMGSDIPPEDRRANANDRLEHLARIPFYEAMARQIRALIDRAPGEG